MNKTLNSLMAVVMTVGFAGAALAQTGASTAAPAVADKKVEVAKPATTAAAPAKAEAVKPAKAHKVHGHTAKGEKHGKPAKAELKSEVKSDVKSEGKAPAAK